MNISTAKFPKKITSEIILQQGLFPNNNWLPLLIYHSVFTINELAKNGIINLLKQNEWGNSWVGDIYDYHHYHSNTHECLIVIAGECDVIYGGPSGHICRVSQGDVIIHPVGVSHKKMHSSENFSCVGAYPDSAKYDMKYGKPEEHPEVDLNIQKTALPKKDPVFGEKGLLFEYWS